MLLAALFVYAGAVKAMRPDLFAIDVFGFDVVSWDVSLWIAHGLPWIEIALGVALLLPTTRIIALRLGLALLLGFTALLAWSVFRGLEGSCGCLGAGDGGLTDAIWRNGIIILVASALLYVEQRRRSRRSAVSNVAL